MAWYIIKHRNKFTFPFKSNHICIVGITNGYGLYDRMIGVRFPAGDGNFSLRHHVQTVSGSHPASYQMVTRGSFPGGKPAGV
jgi:hypothetical protein